MGEYRIPREIQTGLGRTQATTGYGQGNFASSASSLPRMHAADGGSNFGATTNVGPTSTIRNQIMAEMNTAPPEEDQWLDLVNQQQMFKIAVKKINKSMVMKKREEIFELAAKKRNNGFPSEANFLNNK
jgi:hypothetical protein